MLVQNPREVIEQAQQEGDRYIIVDLSGPGRGWVVVDISQGRPEDIWGNNETVAQENLDSEEAATDWVKSKGQTDVHVLLYPSSLTKEANHGPY